MSRDFVPLTEPEAVAALRAFPHWSVHDNRLHVELTFADFVEAFAFLIKVALAAERLGHHPTIENSYKTVRLTLYTHDIDGLSSADVLLAQEIERLLEKKS